MDMETFFGNFVQLFLRLEQRWKVSISDFIYNLERKHELSHEKLEIFLLFEPWNDKERDRGKT